jgi:hypothetical protein
MNHERVAPSQQADFRTLTATDDQRRHVGRGAPVDFTLHGLTDTDQSRKAAAGEDLTIISGRFSYLGPLSISRRRAI